MLSWPTTFSKDETRMHLQARKVHENGPNCHATIPTF